MRKRDGFSDRNGIKTENKSIQLNSLDERTRNRLVSTISELYELFYIGHYSSQPYKDSFCHFVVSEVYADPYDARKSYYANDVLGHIIDTIRFDEYDAVLTIVESLASFWHEKFKGVISAHYKKSIFDCFNEDFEKEYVGYRFIGNQITAISDNNEMDAIKESLKSPNPDVKMHIEKAITFLSDRNVPDYENSIKESISAVEAICSIVSGAQGKEATLGNMLKKLERDGITIHPSLKNAFSALYGYTNDANGIRHAGDIGGPESTFEEAKFMLVACCAFINYLKAVQAKIQKAGK